MTAESKILDIARTVRADAWVDYASRGAFSVGFANNADPATHNKSMATLAERIKAAGFKVVVRAGDEHHACAIITVRA